MKVSPYVVAAALLLSGVGSASAEPKEDGKSRWSHEGRGERFKDMLGLSDEQKDKLKALRRSHRENAAELRGKLQAAMRKLGDQLEDKATDKELASTLDSIASSRKALAQERERFEGAMSSVLTPTQRAKLLAGRMRMAEGRGRGHGKRSLRMRRGGHEGMGGGRGPRPDEEDGD